MAQVNCAEISRALTTLRLVRSSSSPPPAALLRECRALCCAAGDVSVSPEVLARVLRHADETRALLAPLLHDIAPSADDLPSGSEEPVTLLGLPTDVLTQIVGRSSARTLAALDCCCSAFHAPRAPAGRSVVEEALAVAIEATVTRHLVECSPTRIAVAVAQMAELPRAMPVGGAGGGGSGGFGGSGRPSSRRRTVSLRCIEMSLGLARSWGELREVDDADEPHLLGAQPHRLAAAADEGAVPTLQHASSGTASVWESVQYLLSHALPDDDGHERSMELLRDGAAVEALLLGALQGAVWLYGAPVAGPAAELLEHLVVSLDWQVSWLTAPVQTLGARGLVHLLSMSSTHLTSVDAFSKANATTTRLLAPRAAAEAGSEAAEAAAAEAAVAEAVAAHVTVAFAHISCKLDAISSRAVLDAGGPAALVAALDAFPAHAWLQQQCCRALGNLACGGTAAELAVCDAGGAAAVVRAMRRASAAPAGTTTANATADGTGGGGGGVGHGGGHGIAAEPASLSSAGVLARQPPDAGAVHEDGCAALANMAGLLEGKLAVVRAGGAAAVATALLEAYSDAPSDEQQQRQQRQQRQPGAGAPVAWTPSRVSATGGSRALAEEGCRALANLAGGDVECMRAVLAARGPAALVCAAAAHVEQSPPHVLMSASHAFGFLAVAAASGTLAVNGDSVGGGGGAPRGPGGGWWVDEADEVLRHAMQAQPDHTHLKVQGTYALHYLSYVPRPATV